MRMKPIELYALQETGRDALNNPRYELVLIEGAYKGMITQWSTEEIALLDREVTKTQRKLLTDAPLNVIKLADQIRIENSTYSLIDAKSDFIRWRLCHVKEYKT